MRLYVYRQFYLIFTWEISPICCNPVSSSFLSPRIMCFWLILSKLLITKHFSRAIFDEANDIVFTVHYTGVFVVTPSFARAEIEPDLSDRNEMMSVCVLC